MTNNDIPRKIKWQEDTWSIIKDWCVLKKTYAYLKLVWCRGAICRLTWKIWYIQSCLYGTVTSLGCSRVPWRGEVAVVKARVQWHWIVKSTKMLWDDRVRTGLLPVLHHCILRWSLYVIHHIFCWILSVFHRCIRWPVFVDMKILEEQGPKLIKVCASKYFCYTGIIKCIYLKLTRKWGWFWK